MKKYISISFEANAEKREIISALLLSIGFNGSLESGESLTATIEKENYDEAGVDEIMKQQDIKFTVQEVEEENWNEVWEKSFEPVLVDDFAAIRASFHQPLPNVQHEIIITPKMSFGTGHHATTYLMMQQMKTMDFFIKAVIDFGTGTGVLAILAEKLGASDIKAIDNDEWSINNAKENVAANNCNKIVVQLATEISGAEKADVILANINLNVIVENLRNIKQGLTGEGQVLFSGLLKEDLPVISQQLEHHAFEVRNITERNGWICLLTSLKGYPQS